MLEIKIEEEDSIQEWSPDGEEDAGIYIMRDNDSFGPFVWVQVKNNMWTCYEECDLESCTNCGAPISKKEFYIHSDMCQSCYDMELLGVTYGKE